MHTPCGGQNLFFRKVRLFVWEVKLILVFWHDLFKFVAELCLLESEHALVHLFLKQFSSVPVRSQLPHLWSHQPLVAELLLIGSFFDLVMFDLLSLHKGGVVECGIAIELLFNCLHSHLACCWVTLAKCNDVKMVRSKVKLLGSHLLFNFLLIGFRNLFSARKDLVGSFWLLSDEHGILGSSHFIDQPLSF